MKYNLNFNDFAKLFLESLVKETDVDEALICKNSSTWTLVDDRNINSFPPKSKIKAVMNYLKDNFNNVKSFKLSPEIKEDQKVYELYVNVNTLSEPVDGKQYTNDKEARIALYEYMAKEFDWSNSDQLDTIEIGGDEYKIGSAAKTLAGQFNNPKKIILSNYLLNKSILQNSLMPIGLFVEDENGLVLDTLVKFRLEELKDAPVNKKNVIETHIKNASSLVGTIFGGSDQIIGHGGISPKQFSQKLISQLMAMNVPENEFNAYNALFGDEFFNGNAVSGESFDPTKLPDDIKEFLLKSNAMVVIAELLIPWVLVNGITTFGTTNLISALLGGDSPANDKVIAVSWPRGATNENTDYSVSFAKFNSGKEIGISAKSEAGHFTSALPVILANKRKCMKLKNNLGVCARTIDAVQTAVPKTTSVFYCWCMASTIQTGSIDTGKINALYDLYQTLTTSDKRISQKNFAAKYEQTLQNCLNLNYRDVKANYPKALAAWPYSLTNICEQIVVNALNNEPGKNGKDSSRSTFYNIKMGKETAYHQIELYKNNSTVISLKCKPPKEVGSNVDNSASVTFKVATGTGNRIVNPDTDISICRGIAQGSGSHGSVIAVKLND